MFLNLRETYHIYYNTSITRNINPYRNPTMLRQSSTSFQVLIVGVGFIST